MVFYITEARNRIGNSVAGCFLFLFFFLSGASDRIVMVVSPAETLPVAAKVRQVIDGGKVNLAFEENPFFHLTGRKHRQVTVPMRQCVPKDKFLRGIFFSCSLGGWRVPHETTFPSPSPSPSRMLFLHCSGH